MMIVEEALFTKLIHPSLCGCGEPAPPMDQMRRCAQVALLCVQEDPKDRPSMWDVVLMLKGGGDGAAGLPTPKKPARCYGNGGMMPSLAELC